MKGTRKSRHTYRGIHLHEYRGKTLPLILCTIQPLNVVPYNNYNSHTIVKLHRFRGRYRAQILRKFLSYCGHRYWDSYIKIFHIESYGSVQCMDYVFSIEI